MEKPLLLIGIHRDERPFGDRLAQLLGARCDLLRVENGLDNANPTPDGEFHYRIRHTEMYRQVLQQLHRRTGPVIDIHTGLNERGRCADIYCQSEGFLSCLDRALVARPPAGGKARGDVRRVKIVPHEANESRAVAEPGSRPVVWTYIPEAVWRNPHFLYIGIEVFLAAPGPGSEADHAYARDLVLLCADCSAHLEDRRPCLGTGA
ncbi:hypothetical protein AUC68_00605 [Methyloceanibacter methanicus]|uniref:N-formylglutamate amidohydrolase n=1 Tax=Methyloceanibacter methanicus TaxID=1774968 RepID=A0A1E3W6H1_9HYPH|nr:hypothetical protein [Methyloceanibacter methanicus]ODS01394.1 hypothetical protein AUC68_00605 [Methyloceanibacter methanicus]